MKDKGDHDTCSCVVDEVVAVSEVVDDEAVVCMHDLAVSEVKVDTMAISKVVDAVAVDEGDDDEGVDDEVVDDAMVVYGGVDNAMVVADAMVDDEEVVGEKLQLDVDTVVELHFHFLLLGIQSTENKRKCQKNVSGHCKFPDRTNRPISNLIVLRDYHHSSIQVYTAKHPPKNISKGNGMAAWPRSQRVRLAIRRSWVLFPLLGLVGFVLSCPKFKSTATGCLLPVGVFNPVMLYLNYLLLSSI